MTKALGFLTGVCLTAALFVLMLNGYPHRQSERTSPAALASDIQPSEAMRSAADEAALDVEIAPANATVIAKTDGSEHFASSIAGLINATSVATDSTIAPSDLPVEDETGQPSLSAVQSFVDQSTTAEPQTIASRIESVDGPAPDQARLDDTGNGDAARSHIFWSPFRSEWAARGFAGRLSSATQITIEVVEVGSGRYRAAFDYQDEAQRLERIKHIESITGLKLE